MDLVDRYLNAVRFWLPKVQKQDIISELSEDIRSQIEDKEAALNRPLAAPELEALLKERGSPFSVAGCFLPQRHLIGPTLFPIYVFVLKLAAGLYLIPWLLVWIVLVLFVPSYRAAHPNLALFETLGSLWTTAWVVFAMVTLGFAIGEWVRGRTTARNDWNPRRLPAVRDVLRIPRSSSVAEIVFGAFFLAWWVEGFQFPAAFQNNGAPIMLAPISVWSDFRTTFFLPVVAFLLAGIALGAVALARPYWTRLRLGLRAALDGAAAAIVFSVLGTHAPEIVAAWEKGTHAGAALSKNDMIQTWALLSVAITMGIIALGCLGTAIRNLLRIARYETLRARIPRAQ
jgi:hypothetical protein